MKATTLRKLDEQLVEAYWSERDGANDPDSYGYLADLVRDLDDREDYGETGKLPSEADREYELRGEGGEYLLFHAGSAEPKYIILTPEAFSSRFHLEEA